MQQHKQQTESSHSVAAKPAGRRSHRNCLSTLIVPRCVRDRGTSAAKQTKPQIQVNLSVYQQKIQLVVSAGTPVSKKGSKKLIAIIGKHIIGCKAQVYWEHYQKSWTYRSSSELCAGKDRVLMKSWFT